MSLLDAMLLDPHKHPRDVWIALRPDGNMGSGTASDPLNGGVNLEPAQDVTLTRSGTTAEATTSSRHGFDQGDVVTITGALISGSPSAHDFQPGDLVVIEAADSDYIGVFQIVEVPTNQSFKFRMNTAPGSNRSASGYYGKRWQTKKVIVENNIFELASTSEAEGTPVAINVGMAEVSAAPEHVFPLVVVRHNLITHVDQSLIDDAETSDNGIAVQLQSVKNAIIENNTVRLFRSDSIRHKESMNIKCFNNRNQNRKLVRARKDEDGSLSKEVADRIEDAALLSIL